MTVPDTITRTFPLIIDSTYVANTVLELFHLRDMSFDADERVAVYLEAWFCNLNLKSFQPGIIPEFEGDESEREKMSLFTAAENKSQKLGLQILDRKNNTGNWEETAEIILVNRERKDYFDLMQPYLTKNPVRILEKNDAFGIKLIDYGNGLLKVGDRIKIILGVTITISKKNDVEALQARISALELALEGKLINLPSNSLLGRNSENGIVEIVSQSKFATPAQIDQAITDLAGGAPGALNTLIELANALNNDANFASTMTNALATKAPTNNPVFTGFAKIGSNTGLAFHKLEGITPPAQGQAVSVAHGLTGDKILGFTCKVSQSANAGLDSGFIQSPGYSFNCYHDATNFYVTLISSNSANILSKPFRIFVVSVA
ncbi:hypothetical protein QUB47_19060 [Microcoleus sp. AT9_B5]